MADEIKPAEGSSEQDPTVAANGDIEQVKPDTSGNDTDKGSVDSGSTPSKDDLLAGLDLSKFPDEARDIARTWAQKREDDKLRYITQKAQTYADAEKKAKAYDEFVATELDGYKAWKSSQAGAPQQPAPQQAPQASPALVQSYLNAGYTEQEAMQMADSVQATVRQELASKEQQFNQKLTQLQANDEKVQSRQLVQDLVATFPDVQEGITNGTFAPFVQHYCRVEGQPLEVAYQKWSELRNSGAKKAQQQQQDRVKEKMDASSMPRTPVGKTEVVYVDDPKLITRTAAQYASDGKIVQVRYRKK